MVFDSELAPFHENSNSNAQLISSGGEASGESHNRSEGGRDESTNTVEFEQTQHTNKA